MNVSWFEVSLTQSIKFGSWRWHFCTLNVEWVPIYMCAPSPASLSLSVLTTNRQLLSSVPDRTCRYNCMCWDRCLSSRLSPLRRMWFRILLKKWLALVGNHGLQLTICHVYAVKIDLYAKVCVYFTNKIVIMNVQMGKNIFKCWLTFEYNENSPSA